MFYLVLLTISFGLSVLIIPILRRMAVRHNIMIDVPGERKLHAVPTPCIGGIGIALASFAAIAVGFFISQFMEGVEFRPLMGIVLGGMVIILLGVLDDIKPLCAHKKFLGQIIAALILILFDIRIRSINIPFWHMIHLPMGFSIFITIFWILAVTNALNLIDGMDGLAGGVALIASVVLCSLAVARRDISAAVVTIALVGSCSGFLIYNFPPASVFMGDCGSMFLGYALAAVSVQFLYKSFVASIFVPIAILAVPLSDTLLAIARRLWNGSSPFAGDRGHIHHRLQDIGLSMRASVIILYGLCTFLGIIALAATFVNEGTSAIIITVPGMALVPVMMVMISHYAVRRNGKREKEQQRRHSLEESYGKLKEAAVHHER